MKPKILFLLPYFNIAGTETHVIELSKALKNDYEIKIVAPFGKGVELLSKYDISYSEVPVLGLFNYGNYLKRLKKITLDFKPDIVHVHGAHELTFIVKRVEPSTNLLFTCHGYNSEYPFLDYKLSAFFNNKYSNKVIAVSEYEKRNLVKGGILEDKVIVIHNGIRENDEKRDLPLKIDGFIIGTCARLTKKKGINYLIDAFQKVRLYCKDIHLVVIGDGEERANLERLVKKENKDFVHFIGNLKEASPYFHNFHLFVLPSLNEPFGIVILEAMSQKIPVIATKVGGIPEIIVDGESGFLIPPRNSEKLAEAILNLIQNEELRNKLGENGYIRFKENFTIEKMVEKTISVYEEILFNSSK